MRFDLCKGNSFSRSTHAVQDPLMPQNRSLSAESTHANTEASVSGHCLDSSWKGIEEVMSCRNWTLLLFQNRNSSTESAHAKTEASVSGHCLDSSGKSMKRVSKKSDFFKSEKEWDLEYFCEIGMILRLKQKLELSHNNFVELKLDLEYFCPKRRGKRNWT